MEGIGEWREQNSKASLREIEKALDERMTKLRAKVLEEAAQLSELRKWTESENVPVCSGLQEGIGISSKKERELQTQGGQRVLNWNVDMVSVRNAGRAFSPR